MFDPISKDGYSVRKADSLEEVQLAQKLRYEVFNVELGEGLESSLEEKRDEAMDGRDGGDRRLILHRMKSTVTRYWSLGGHVFMQTTASKKY